MEPESRLVWCDCDGRYRLNGGSCRQDVVIPRTRAKLLRLKALREGVGPYPSLYITETGRRMVRKYDLQAEMLASRRKDK